MCRLGWKGYGMRLISQNGGVDIPYELSALSIARTGDKYTIYVRSKLFDERPVAFADYSSEVVALAAMYAVRENYSKMADRLSKNLSVDDYAVFCFPQDSEVEA